MKFQKIAFLFAGQGAQFVGMGQDLAAGSAAARAVFDRADAALGRSVSRLCFDGPLDELTAGENCQPAIYTMSLAALAALRERAPGLEPAFCGGLSLGEFAALTAAGSLDFDAGVRLVAARGRFMQEACRLAEGAMAAVLNAAAELVEEVAVRCDVDVANLNCPGQIVISGEKDKIARAVAELGEAGVQRIVMLQVDGAFHSRPMAGAAEKFAGVLASTEIRPPRCPVAQNVAGALVTDPEEIRGNLAAQVTGTVRWEQCVRAMLDAGAEAVIELGPGRVLSGFMRRIDRSVPVWNIGSTADLDKAVQALTR